MSESSAAPSREPDRTAEDSVPAASARFRIRIDALGRIVPEVIPAGEDAADDPEPR